MSAEQSKKAPPVVTRDSRPEAQAGFVPTDQVGATGAYIPEGQARLAPTDQVGATGASIPDDQTGLAPHGPKWGRGRLRARRPDEPRGSASGVPGAISFRPHPAAVATS